MIQVVVGQPFDTGPQLEVTSFLVARVRITRLPRSLNGGVPYNMCFRFSSGIAAGVWVRPLRRTQFTICFVCGVFIVAQIYSRLLIVAGFVLWCVV